MPPSHVSEFLVDADLARLQQEAESENQRDKLLLRLINVGLALNYEGVNLNHNAMMVLSLVATAQGIGVSRLADALHLTPGGASKILDQLSVGRMVRGVRQPGFNLIQREPGQGCFLTKEGERIVTVIVGALKPA